MNSYVSLLGKKIAYLELKTTPMMAEIKIKMIKIQVQKQIKIQVKKKLLNQENYPLMIPKEEMITLNKMLQPQEISSLRDGLDCH